MLSLVRLSERGQAGPLQWLARLLLLALCSLPSACSAEMSGDDDSGGGGKGGAGRGAGGTTAAGAPGAGGLASSVECPIGQNACGTTCTNLQADPNHCGNCATVCPTGMACQAGACQSQCGLGQALCGGVCKTIVSDPANCGACGTACLAGQFCVSGACSNACPLQPCDGAGGGVECADVASNPSHCGACGAACAAGQSCIQVKCAVACPSGQTACGGVCTDLMTNQASCGACGTACPAGTPCINGHCGCGAGETLCGGACVDVTSSAANCGGCGKTCAAGQVCQAGLCAAGCSGSLVACGGGCVDTMTSGAHCGTCNTACPAAQACVAGKCECPSAGTLCGSACVSTQTDGKNCGACGTACGTAQTCVAGKCDCAGEDTPCGDACVNTQVSNDHCGTCNAGCSGGKTCVAGECQCPAGQESCSGACVDTQTSPASCGTCGNACATGQTCEAGKCFGAGGVGADGCTGGVARNISLSRIDALQTVQVGIMLNGEAVSGSARNTDLVTGKETVFRVFVTPGSGWSARELSARVTVVNGAISDEYFAKRTVSMASTVGAADSTLQVTVPADKIAADSQYHVELVECGTPPAGDMAKPRFPATGDVALGARVTGGVKVRMIPLRANSRVPETDEEGLKPYQDIMAAMYPADTITLEVGDVIDIDYPIQWEEALEQVRAKRAADKPTSDVYYYGILRPNDTFSQFCGGGCTAGVGYVGSQSSAAYRVAIGIGFPGNQSAITMAHEVGHNHGRNHAPCVPQGGSISGVDENFPYSGAAITVWGYDSRTKALVNPSGITDIMGYCNNQWISDYTYDGILSRVVGVNGAARIVQNPAALSHWRVLLLGSRGPRWGVPIDEPSAPEGTAEVAEIFDDAGNVSEYVVVYRTEVSDIGAASILVPEPKAGWYAVGINGQAPLPFAAPRLRKGF
jgi:hypothetical protein